jgi:hypothetical protein
VRITSPSPFENDLINIFEICYFIISYQNLILSHMSVMNLKANHIARSKNDDNFHCDVMLTLSRSFKTDILFFCYNIVV